MNKLTHLNKKGNAAMVDVSDKKEQLRIAKAMGDISLKTETLALIRENALKKGDVISVARIAGIQAAKATSSLIPLCHPLRITNIEMEIDVYDIGIKMQCTVTCIGQTGVEMEALTGVSVALLTVYDMCKAVDKNMVINNVHLANKEKKDI
ncbi:MAG: cyclic pyranopterin monophosphate synthase MoaC [Chloroflexia bacterium]|nr:cyclic pyranopterin monophosphate synthase MoaC [Chloroflexia bacterium]